MRSDPTVWLARVVRMRATLTTMHLSCQCTSACAQHQRLGGSAENEYAFVPRTFVLPRDGWLLRYDAMNGGSALYAWAMLTGSSPLREPRWGCATTGHDAGMRSG